jgi:hypothetical protein
MAKVIWNTWEVTITKNLEKGGAWLTLCVLKDELGDTEKAITNAWSNASAAKRDVKATVGRKTMKFIEAGEDAKGKPTSYTAVVQVKK